MSLSQSSQYDGQSRESWKVVCTCPETMSCCVTFRLSPTAEMRPNGAMRIVPSTSMFTVPESTSMWPCTRAYRRGDHR